MECDDFFHESLDFKDIRWKIRNVFSMPERVGYYVQSPSFSFAGATWELRMYPYGEAEESQGYMDVSICRMDYQIPQQHVSYKFCVKTRRGKEFENHCTTQWFIPNSNEWIVTKFLKKSILIEKKNVIVPNGVLTILCQMQIKKTAGIDRYSQTESIALQSESPKNDSKVEPESPETSNCIGCDCRLRQPAQHIVNKTFQDFKELFLKQEECDVIIKVKEQEFRAHKAILIARSPVFASTFRNDMKEKSTGVIDIEDCDPSFFSDFLCFLYCGNVEILTIGNVFSLFTAADKYDVQDLRLECLEFMKNNLSVDTFCETLTLALRHFEKELIEFTTDFFAKHWEEILVTVKWQSFIVENPIQSNEIMVKALILKKK